VGAARGGRPATLPSLPRGIRSVLAVEGSLRRAGRRALDRSGPIEAHLIRGKGVSWKGERLHEALTPPTVRWARRCSALVTLERVQGPTPNPEEPLNFWLASGAGSQVLGRHARPRQWPRPVRVRPWVLSSV